MENNGRSKSDDCPVVVLIDDDEDSRAIYRTMLSAAGVDVVTASDEEVGLLVCRAARPAVVLLNIDLTRLTGFVATQQDQREPALRRARIIALTCLAWEHEPKRLRDAVFDRVLMKPILPVVVRDVVLAALSAPRRRSGEWSIRSPVTLTR
jgi:DNA-binding response OmpR family regulator